MKTAAELIKELDSGVLDLISKIGRPGGRKTMNNLSSLLGSAMVVATDQTITDVERIDLGRYICLATAVINAWIRINK